MALLRVIHGASMPDPGELARAIEGGALTQASQNGESAASNVTATPTTPSAENKTAAISAASLPASFADLLELVGCKSINLEMTLRDVMRVAEYSPPLLGYQLAGPVPSGFLKDLSDALKTVTGQRWQLEERAGDAPPSLYEVERAAAKADKKAIMESPLVKAAFSAFPDAKLLEPEKGEDENRSASA